MDTIIYLEKVYSEINDNIKFSETKNAALITLNSALIAFVGIMIFDKEILLCYRYFLSILVLALSVPLALSLFSFKSANGSERCIVKKFYDFLDSKNKTQITPEKYMYYAYIHKHFSNNPESYLSIISPCNTQKEPQSLFYQMAQQIVDLSAVTYRKFTSFNIAISIEISEFIIFGIISFIILICKII